MLTTQKVVGTLKRAGFQSAAADTALRGYSFCVRAGFKVERSRYSKTDTVRVWHQPVDTTNSYQATDNTYRDSCRAESQKMQRAYQAALEAAGLEVTVDQGVLTLRVLQ